MKYIKFIAAVVVILAIAGAYYYPQVSKTVGAAGDTFSTGTIAQIGISPSVNVFGSLYNGSGRDLVVTSYYLYFKGYASTTGDATIAFATSTAATTIGTGSIYSATLASTTLGNAITYASSTSVTANVNLWPNGTYLNASSSLPLNSTSTGVFGVRYFSL